MSAGGGSIGGGGGRSGNYDTFGEPRRGAEGSGGSSGNRPRRMSSDEGKGRALGSSSASSSGKRREIIRTTTLLERVRDVTGGGSGDVRQPGGKLLGEAPEYAIYRSQLVKLEKSLDTFIAELRDSWDKMMNDTFTLDDAKILSNAEANYKNEKLWFEGKEHFYLGKGIYDKIKVVEQLEGVVILRLNPSEYDERVVEYGDALPSNWPGSEEAMSEAVRVINAEALVNTTLDAMEEDNDARQQRVRAVWEQVNKLKDLMGAYPSWQLVDTYRVEYNQGFELLSEFLSGGGIERNLCNALEVQLLSLGGKITQLKFGQGSVQEAWIRKFEELHLEWSYKRGVSLMDSVEAVDGFKTALEEQMGLFAQELESRGLSEADGAEFLGDAYVRILALTEVVREHLGAIGSEGE